MTTLLLRYFEAILRRFDAGTQTSHIASVGFLPQVLFGAQSTVQAFTDFGEYRRDYGGGTVRPPRNDELVRRAWQVLDELR
jgi:hypothetical protein